MENKEIYAEPIEVNENDEKFFYHTVEIPGKGVISGNWDLRPYVDDYLGKNVNYNGKRVIDIGAASGFLSFEMEKRGAEVVSFDMLTGAQWDIVPTFGRDVKEITKSKVHYDQKLKNAYWYVHKILNSKIKVFYGDINNLPEGLGRFDVGFFGTIISHLMNPFKALYSASRLCDNIVITNPMSIQGDVPLLRFHGDHEYWFEFSEASLTRMLEVLGFNKTSKNIFIMEKEDANVGNRVTYTTLVFTKILTSSSKKT